MMGTFYKAVRPDGGSFHNPAFVWDTTPGGVTTHPAFDKNTGDAVGYLSVATVATDCTGFRWPCRLLEVEPHRCRVFTPDRQQLPNKRAGRAFRTVRELPAREVFGPNGESVVAVIDRAATLTYDETRRIDAAWDAARDAARYATWFAAWDAARYAAWDATRFAARYAARAAARYAARDAARYAAWDAARDATWAELVRDLIAPEHYDTLIGPWVSVVGE